ncbi:MAG: glycerol-3-phosphate 1-O-acyltransferase PlsY [Desulfovermiculus sp.]|nr:glycerol-3-phosphate 1-O-acyltransferase PlsY [Desulfovermiculus sp.]
MNIVIAGLGWLLVVYLIGSIPFGLIVSRLANGIDPRLTGSKSTGATNVARTCGIGYGILTFVLDAAKGLIPILLAMGINDSAAFITLTGVAVLAGHLYSAFLGGKGGKGVATTIGIFLALTPTPLFWAVVLCILLIWATGFVSIGSLSMVTLLPIFILISGAFSYLILSLIVMALVYSKHRENILRLARGQENPWQKDKYILN